MSGLMSLALFLAVGVALMAGFVVAFTLAGVALIFAGIGVLSGTFDPSFLEAFPNRVFGIMSNETLMTIPVFVFMGVMLERSKLAEQLLQSLAQIMRRIPGGRGCRGCDGAGPDAWSVQPGDPARYGVPVRTGQCDGFHDPDRCLAVQPGVSRFWRR